MIAARTLMNATAQAARFELRFGRGRARRAVRVHIGRRVGLVQKSTEFSAVMHARVGHLVVTDQLVLGIRIHVVLVAVEALPCFLVQRASLSFCRFFAGFFCHSFGVLPAFTASFSSRLLRCLGTGTIVASTIWPPRAM